MSETRRIPASAYVPLGATGLSVSRVGFGCYRVDDETPEHREALLAALAAGCNLIDTSTNYMDGASERLVGEVLEDLGRRDRAARERVIVVSKIGYVQGENLRLARERERAGRSFHEMVKYTDGCWHCIHPEFLRDQLARSRERLRVETLDVCLLHNPEYFLSDAAKHGGGRDLEGARSDFYRRVRDAFACLEEAARQGQIRWYGVSSNTLVAPADDPEATSVSRYVTAAQEAGGRNHRFRVVQMPMNLFESGGALERNTGPGGSQTPLQAAAAAGLGVLVNRPLNASVANRLLRLADIIEVGRETPLERPLETLRTLEREYLDGVAPADGGPEEVTPEQFFRFFDEVAGLPDQIDGIEQWQQIEQQYVIPRINYMARALGQRVPAERADWWRAWWGRCLPALQDLLREIGRRAAGRSRRRVAALAASIDPALPPERRGASLSGKAIWVLASTPGVSCVLVGMRRTPYVEDALGTLDWPPLPDPLAVYRALAS